MNHRLWTKRAAWAALLCAAVSLPACADSGGSGGADGAPPGGADAMGTPDSGGALVDPLAAQPDESEGLVNVSASLDAVLENGALAGACDDYFAGPKTDRKKMLLCGKWMFFYEHFGGYGIPKGVTKFLLEKFPDEIGPGFEKLGMIADPTSDIHLPIGLADAAPINNVATVTFTCASCHFARLPDGRYAVGAPNHAYDYGKMNLRVMVFLMGAVATDRSGFAPEAMSVVQPMFTKIDADVGLKLELLGILAGMIGLPQPSFPVEAQRHYASWKPGVLDPFIEPQPYNDKFHTASKMQAVWDIPRPAEAAAAGMRHGMLGSAGNSKSVMSFLVGFVGFFGGDAKIYNEERLAPLAEYIYSLRSPQNPNAPDEAAARAGLRLYHDKGCAGCHSGPRGSGLDLYTFDEIGTDKALERWLDPDRTGSVCCDAPLPADEPLTYKLKSPRLAGLWTQKRFLHNGAVDSLGELLCLDGPRPASQGEPLGNGGHTYGCELPRAEKLAIIDYLLAR
jgi:hypothetical protein